MKATGSPGALTSNYVNPTNRIEAGSFAGEVAALALNLRFDDCDADWSTSCIELRQVRVCHSNPCKTWEGWTVGEIFDLGNNVLGGCTPMSQINKLDGCIQFINNAFRGGAELAIGAAGQFSSGAC